MAIVPGLGLTAYLRPLERALRARGADVRLLDLPGVGRGRPLACAPDVVAVGEAVAAEVGRTWPRGASDDGPVVVLGHSTGAQGALHAALALQRAGRDVCLVMAGPTPAPTQRTLRSIALASTTAYRRDSLRELVIAPQLARGVADVLRLLRTALADRPERHVAELTGPLVVTAGVADSLAPPWWLDHLARAAQRSPHAEVVRLPGSHNNPFTRPDLLADLVLGAAAR